MSEVSVTSRLDPMIFAEEEASTQKPIYQIDLEEFGIPDLSTRERRSFMPTMSKLEFNYAVWHRDGPVWYIPNALIFGVKVILSLAFDVFVMAPYLVYDNIRRHYQIQNLDLKLEKNKDRASIINDLNEIGAEIALRANGDPAKLQQLIQAYATDRYFITSLHVDDIESRRMRMASVIAYTAISSYANLFIEGQYKRHEYLFNCGIHNLTHEIDAIANGFGNANQISEIFLNILNRRDRNVFQRFDDTNTLIEIGTARYNAMTDEKKNEANRDNTFLSLHASLQATAQQRRLALFLEGHQIQDVRVENRLIAAPFLDISREWEVLSHDEISPARRATPLPQKKEAERKTYTKKKAYASLDEDDRELLDLFSETRFLQNFG